MPFAGLTIGTERANAFQNAIQDELQRRGFSADPDPVMAEYITIMVINNKTAAQITSELEDLIGGEFDPSFTEWLFTEAAKGSEPDSVAAQTAQPEAPAPSSSTSRSLPVGPRQGGPSAHSNAPAPIPTLSPTGGAKRSASARSPSPGHPSKARRTDGPPTGPRAERSGPHHSPPSGPRSLLDRVGPRQQNHGPPFNHNNHNGGFPPNMPMHLANMDPAMMAQMQQQMAMGGMDPNMMGGGGMDMGPMAGANPLMLQEMMMNQMALMAQMATSMGIINPNGQPMFPNQHMAGPGFNPNENGAQRGGGRGGFNGRGRGRGRGGQHNVGGHDAQAQEPTQAADAQALNPQAPAFMPTAQPVHTPTPVPAVSPRPDVPERPLSPTLCKFGLKCTNALCRWSHPSPVATPESGVVLSNDPCENGKDCKDKDCVKAHVSPAVLNPNAEFKPQTAPAAPQKPVKQAPIPCRYGAACTRQNTGCPYSHPAAPAASSNVQCRFGSGCTRANCSFQHPADRVLPNSFHRGVGADAPLVAVKAPASGSMSSGSTGQGHNRSVTFNGGAGTTGGAVTKEDLERRMKALEEQKKQMTKQMEDARAAKNAKGESPAVPTAA